MNVQCPNCGAPVEFRFDDSFVRICGNCKNAVVRSDRGIESLGKMADLAPMASPLALFAEGKYAGRGFLLIGKAQIQHSAGGIWQEWYAKFDDGRWGWIAEHQGKFSVSFEVPNGAAALPSADQLAAGSRVDIGGSTPYTVTEFGTGKYLGAEGELPFRLEANVWFLFADMSDGTGSFATLDYGDPNAPQQTPTLFAGAWVELSALGISGGERQPASANLQQAKRLACPECNGAVDLRLPDSSMRVVCPYCNQLISTENGTLALLGKLASKAKPAIPLGTKCNFPQFAPGGTDPQGKPGTAAPAPSPFTVVGYQRRSAWVDYSWYPFHEYLLHHADLGFRWLVCSDGHWSFVEPVDTAATQAAGTRDREYQGVKFKAYASCTLRVDEVYGEFYWRVKTGDLSTTLDAIAPPAMLSRELEGQELNTSLSTYLSLAEVRKATGVQVPDTQQGVAPNAPLKLPHLGKVALALFGVLLTLGIVFKAKANPRQLVNQTFTVPAGKPNLPPPPAEVGPVAPEDQPGNAFFTEPFEVKAGQNIEFVVGTYGLTNSWAYVVVDLVDESTGTFVSVDHEMESYSGYEDGEYWSEGTNQRKRTISPIKAGTYVARVEAVHGMTDNARVDLVIRQNVFQGAYLIMALGFLLIIFVILALVRWRHDKKRWENSGFYGPPAASQAGDDEDDDDDDDGFFAGDDDE